MLEATAIIENDNCLVSSTSRIDAVMQTVSQIPFQQPLYWHNSYVVALLVNRYISVRDVAAREPRRGLRIKRRGREGGSEGGGGSGGDEESEAVKGEERAWDALKGGISVHREGGKQEVERRERKEGGDFFANRRARQTWEENERRAALEYEGWTEEEEEEEEGEGEEGGGGGGGGGMGG
ncbi:hypothetical protein NSK_006443 [Nannochloropsis salina CCMP1776]|uniref:Uncharacterized protein n=1 Tax=Nannochloropsis salina CCMP1776 TaxID=1027361 RepID=A0A4D9CUR0_9STRA|nr:hypothetical protein NSK_006443 [Nannochloropsis salina CCMP1776]|eukprot:TFJ82324.1 hypothetical protein NSK_006443 [Nannochloropsis salina CCMP1776]